MLRAQALVLGVRTASVYKPSWLHAVGWNLFCLHNSRGKLVIWKAKPLDHIASSKDNLPGSIEIQDDSVLITAGQGAIRVLECQIEGGPELRTFDELKTAFRDDDRFDQQERIS